MLFGEAEQISPHVAAYVGDIFLLQSLIQTEKDANLRDKRNTTPLHHAIYGGYEDCALFLLECGAEVDALDDRGISPLHIASSQGHLDCLKLLIKFGANVNLAETNITTQRISVEDDDDPLLNPSDYSCSALHIACLQGKADCVKELLKNGADVELLDQKGATVLHNSTFIGAAACTELICNHLTVKNSYILNVGDNNGITPLHQASYLGHTECLKILILSSCELIPRDSQGRTPLHLAAYNGHVGCVQILLEEIKAIDHKKRAISTISKSVNFAVPKQMARRASGFLGQRGLEVFSPDFLLRVNTVDEYGATPLHLASYSGKLDCVNSLLEFGADINAVDIEGATALHKASFGGYEAIIQVLLKKSCNVNVVDIFGDTPLHKCAYNGYDECAEVLIQSGADRTLQDSSGYLPLHNCAETKNLSCLDKIIDANTINSAENNGFTPLHLAVIENHLEVVQYLVSKVDIGVNVNALDNNEHSPLYCAIERANEAIVRELIFEGADINVGKCTELASEPSSSITVEKLNQFITDKERKEKMSKNMDPETRAKISRLVALFNTKPSKGMKMLIDEGVVGSSNKEIAEFLHTNEKLNKKSIGELLGEAENVELLRAFAEHLDFTGFGFEQALRLFLSTFRLPGEAQKIDRMMESFAARFYQQVADGGIFASADAVYILAFSVIMLNTDAHNPAIKKQNKMTRQQFVSNNRGINDGGDIDAKYLEHIYDRIVEEEIKMDSEQSLFANAEKKGYLTKQGGRVKTWKKRWFVLTSNNLYYFKAPGEEHKPCGWIPLEDLKIVQGKDRKQKWTLVIQSSIPGSLIKSGKLVDGQVLQGSHSRFIISAATQEEMKSWIDAIESNMQKNPHLSDKGSFANNVYSSSAIN